MASHSQRPRGERLIVGITGRIGSGKTTVGRYLESKYAFQYLRYSEVLAEWLAADPDKRHQLQKLGWEVMAGGMQAELNRRLIARILPGSDVAVDGLRHLLDDDSLHQFDPFFRLVFIHSSSETRFGRLNKKGKYADMPSFQAADSHPVEQHIDSLRARAALVIRNEGTLDTLYAAADEAISRFRKEGLP